MVLEAREKKRRTRSSEYETLKPGGKGCKRKNWYYQEYELAR